MDGVAGDAYAPLLRMHLSELSDSDARLFRREAGLVIEIKDETGQSLSHDELEQKIMERFAEEEAARP
jgi:predicted CopG family antitoxin